MNELEQARQDLIENQPQLLESFVNYVDRCPRTTRTYLANLRHFFSWMQSKGIRQPVRDDIIQYRNDLTAAHKPNTVKLYLQSVKQFFAWLSTENLYPDISKNIHAPKVTDTHRKDSLTAGEVLKIEQSINDQNERRAQEAQEAQKDTAGRTQRNSEQGKRLLALYLLAVNAGLRTIELSRANIKDLEVKGGCAYLYIFGKGHTEADQKKPLAPEVYQAIKAYLDSRTDAKTAASPLFVSTGNRSGGKRIAPTTISTMLKQAMVEAGYNSERLTAHSLRHTAGQNVMELTGNNIYTTQLYMRHTSPKTTELYLDNDKAAQDATIAQALYKHYHSA